MSQQKERLEAAIKAVVDKAPPLSEEKKRQLRLILGT